MKPYSPKGKTLLLLSAMRAEPDRQWSLKEAGAAMGMRSNKVAATIAYALRAGAIYRGGQTRATRLSLQPFDGRMAVPVPEIKKYEGFVNIQDGWVTGWDDPRVPKVVPGWRAPQMIAPRG